MSHSGQKRIILFLVKWATNEDQMRKKVADTPLHPPHPPNAAVDCIGNAAKLHCTYIMSAHFISTTGHCNSSIDMPQLATWLLQASIFLTCTFQGPPCTPACRCSRIAHRYIYICSALLFYRNQQKYLGTSTLMGVWLCYLPLIALNYRHSSALSCSCADKENSPKKYSLSFPFHKKG